MCVTDDCNEKHFAKGFCYTHYRQHVRQMKPEREILHSMRQRCHNPNSKDFKYYGAKGVEVCERWRTGEDGMKGGDCFLFDMGKRPSSGHSIDRINPFGNYEPSNCRWATRAEQMKNQRRNYKK